MKLKLDENLDDFARVTLKQAQATYGQTSKEARAVKGGWDTVEVPL